MDGRAGFTVLVMATAPYAVPLRLSFFDWNAIRNIPMVLVLSLLLLLLLLLLLEHRRPIARG